MSESDNKPQNKLEASQFKPGQTGNPGGRPSIAALRAALKPHERKVVETLVACLDSENDKIRIEAAREILDRLYGKVAASGEGAGWLSDEKIVELLS